METAGLIVVAAAFAICAGGTMFALREAYTNFIKDPACECGCLRSDHPFIIARDMMQAPPCIRCDCKGFKRDG